METLTGYNYDLDFDHYILFKTPPVYTSYVKYPYTVVKGILEKHQGKVNFSEPRKPQ